MSKREGSKPAAIEYAGVSGGSKDCQNAILRYIQFGEKVTNAKILSCDRDHCFLLTIDEVDLVAVKSGFASGYGGEGPRRFSYSLQVLDSHGAEIEEYDVSHDFIERVDLSALTRDDLQYLESARPRHPSRWPEYILDFHFEKSQKGTLWKQEFPSILPLALLDSRMADLAIHFWDSPDNSLLVGYRRLEDIIRKATGLEQHGAKLFSQAFSPNAGLLTWKDLDEGELAGRMQLFIGTYSAHRNPRAHRELKAHGAELLSGFLLLNHLYILESESVAVNRKPAQS